MDKHLSKQSDFFIPKEPTTSNGDLKAKKIIFFKDLECPDVTNINHSHHMFKINKDVLLTELNKVSGVIDRKHTLPVLSNVLIRIESEKIEVIGSNLDIQLTSIAQLDTPTGLTEKLEIATDCKNLISILKIMRSSEPIDFEIHSESARLQLSHASGIRNINTHSATEFPVALRKEEQTSRFSIKEKVLKEALKKTAFSMATQDIRYYLNGMLMQVEDQQLELVSTDGHRLGYTRTELESSDGNVKIIIPRKTVQELQKLLSDTDDTVIVEMSDNQAVFRFASLELITKVIEGKFPDYTKVIPVDNTIQLRFDAHRLQGALTGVSVLMSDKFKGVKVNLKDNRMTLSSQNEKKEYSEEVLEIDYTEDELDIGFNVNYILDFLNSMEQRSETVCISLSDSNSSALFTVEGDAQYRYVVMPMRI